MSRYPFESEFLYGLHDPGGEPLMREAGCPGWVVISEQVGANPDDQGGSDQNYGALTSAGYGIIVRLNHGYYNSGTLPVSSQYANFAQRCANFVTHLPDVHLWIIGNEMNLAAERPGVQIDTARSAIPRGMAPSPHELRDLLSVFAPHPRGESAITNPGETITPELYVSCYRQCRTAIHKLPDHENDLVLVGAVAPWNDNTGDWIQYFQHMLTQLGPDGCDGITIHTYTHGATPDLITDDSKMGAPYQQYHFNFRAYKDFMQTIPDNMRALPVYITETDQNDVWQDNPTDWLQRAYGEIDWWNQQAGNQQIRALVLYRWQPFDRWGMQDHSGIHDAFRAAMQSAYRWHADAVAQPTAPAPFAKPVVAAASHFSVNQQVYAATVVNVRKSAGYVDKPSDDVIGQIAFGTAVTITGASVQQDGLTWWPLQAMLNNGVGIDGWAAEALPDTLLLSADAPPPQAAPRAATRGLVKTYSAGDVVAIVTPDPVNIRHSPGYTDKGPEDILTTVAGGTTLTIGDGPTVVDDLYWWQVSGATSDNQSITGYVAEASPNGVRLITPASLSQIITVQRPFQGDFPVTRWWGEDPAFYSQFTYDGVPLKGHNGIDFGTPINTPLVAADAGQVKKVDFEAEGFGHHILLEHSWGESLYAHLEQVHVEIDQQVQAGEVIGLSGNSGASTGPHLHFGLRLDPYRRIDGWGGFADPQPFMNAADLIGSRSTQGAPTPMAPEVPGRPRP